MKTKMSAQTISGIVRSRLSIARPERPCLEEEAAVEERPRRQNGQRQRDADGQERADQRDREGLDRPRARLAQRSGRKIGREESADVDRDLAEGLAAEQAEEIDACALPRPDEERREAPADPERPGAARRHRRHARHQATRARIRPLMKSTAATSPKRIPRSVSASSNWNIRMESSICWPSPPAPTKPRIAEARM